MGSLSVTCWLLATAPRGELSCTRSAQRRCRLGEKPLSREVPGWGSKHHQSDSVFWPIHHWTRPGKSLPFQRFHKCSIYLLFFLFSLWSFFFPTTKTPWCFHMVANLYKQYKGMKYWYVTTWVDLKGITLSAKSHSEKVIHCIRPFIWHSWSDKMIGMENRLELAWG